MHAEILTLRLIHVLSGVFWLGSGLFSTFFLVPAIALSGVPAGPLYAALGKRKMFVAMPLAAVLTTLSGIRLMWIASAGRLGDYVGSPTGRTFAIGGAAAVIAFLLSLIVARPSFVRVGTLQRELANLDGTERERMNAKIAALQKRAGLASTIAVALMLIAGGAMAVARYMT